MLSNELFLLYPVVGKTGKNRSHSSIQNSSNFLVASSISWVPAIMGAFIPPIDVSATISRLIRHFLWI